MWLRVRVERCEMDPNLVGVLLSSSSESEPLCEMSSEWTPMPQPLVVDSGGADSTVEDVVSKPQDSRIRRVEAQCVPQHCGKQRRENVAHVDIG